MTESDETRDESDELCGALFLRWKMLAMPPLDGSMAPDQGLIALEKCCAWMDWASCVLKSRRDGVDVELVLRALRDIQGVIENVRVDDGRAGERELINTVVLRVEQCASSFVAAPGFAADIETAESERDAPKVEAAKDRATESREEAMTVALETSIRLTAAIAPRIAETLKLNQDALLDVIDSFNCGHRRRAVGTLIRMLDPLKKHSENKDLYETFKEWEQRRFKRLPRRDR